MTRKPRERNAEEPEASSGRAADEAEGRESVAEECEGGDLRPNEELEEALREAVESVEARQEARGEGPEPAPEAPPGSDEPVALGVNVRSPRHIHRGKGGRKPRFLSGRSLTTTHSGRGTSTRE